MYYIGCSGWFYWHWKGKFYPEDIPQSRWFRYYAEKFATVELNAPFYRFPKTSTAKGWYKNSPKDFIFTLKVNRTITHIKRFKGTARLIKDFYRLGDEVKEKMGCFLFQLPPNIRYSESKLQEILRQLDPRKKNILEFRHESWFIDDVYEELKKNGVIFCIVSTPKLPDTFVKTADDVYIRFHGPASRYSSDYSNKELQSWAKRIRQSGAKNVWAYFNNDYNAYAPKNALYLRKLLQEA
ncbi:MAG: DUF72 domain-containing protein [Candidatus Zixiibacteriota bacterium]